MSTSIKSPESSDVRKPNEQTAGAGGQTAPFLFSFNADYTTKEGMNGMELNEIKTEYDVLKHGLLTSVAVTNVDLSDDQRAHYLDLLNRFEHAAKQVDDKALSKLKGAVMQAIYASQAYLIANNRTVKRNAKRECMRAKKVLERTKAREE